MNDEKEKKFGTFGVSESTPEKWKEAPCRSLHGAIAIFATLKMRGQKDQQKPCRRVPCPSLWSEGGKGRSALCAGVFSHPVCYNRRDESRRKVGNPMTLTELWDETAENVTEKVRRAQDPERCASLLEEELDHLLYRYGSSEEDGARRDLAASLLSALRMALPLLARGNRAQLWEAKEENEGKKPAGNTFFAVIGSLLVLVPEVLLLLADHQSPLWVLPSAAGAVLLFLAGRGHRLPKQGKRQKVEILTDAEGTVQTIRNALVVCDQCLADAEKAGGTVSAKETQIGEKDLTREELSLFSGLLCAAGMKDGDYALEEAQKVRDVLHSLGYEAVDCNGTNLSFFERLPGDQDRTILPAIVRDGKLVCRGQAARSAGH